MARAEAVENAMEAPTGGPRAAPTSSVWELDFCSRPIVDERGKKVWELLICDPTRSFEHALYVPTNKINSGEVRRGGWALREPADSIRVGRPACVILLDSAAAAAHSLFPFLRS